MQEFSGVSLYIGSYGYDILFISLAVLYSSSSSQPPELRARAGLRTATDACTEFSACGRNIATADGDNAAGAGTVFPVHAYNAAMFIAIGPNVAEGDIAEDVTVLDGAAVFRFMLIILFMGLWLGGRGEIGLLWLISQYAYRLVKLSKNVFKME